MIEVIDNVFDEKTIDFLYFHYRDATSWRFIGGNVNTDWRKFYKDIQFKANFIAQ